MHHALSRSGAVTDMAGRNNLINACFGFIKNSVAKMQYSSIFFSVDSQDSWRYQFYEQYKGNRSDSNSFINSCIDEFSVRISAKMGNCIVKISGYESDDIIACLAKLNLVAGTTSIIVSSDSDLNQLVYSTKADEPHIIQFDPDKQKRYFYIHNCLEGLERPNDMFSDEMMNPIYDYAVNAKFICPDLRTVIKLMAGDSGDNIPSCYQGINGTKVNFGDARAAKVAVMFPRLADFETANLRMVASQILKTANGKDLGKIDDIVAGLERNKKLILLSDQYINDYAYLENSCKGFVKYKNSADLRTVYEI